MVRLIGKELYLIQKFEVLQMFLLHCDNILSETKLDSAPLLKIILSQIFRTY